MRPCSLQNRLAQYGGNAPGKQDTSTSEREDEEGTEDEDDTDEDDKEGEEEREPYRDTLNSMGEERGINKLETKKKYQLRGEAG